MSIFAITRSKSSITIFSLKRDIATPRLKVKDVLPTPPFPEASAINRDMHFSPDIIFYPTGLQPVLL